MKGYLKKIVVFREAENPHRFAVGIGLTWRFSLLLGFSRDRVGGEKI
jgi:hypothetical protein